MEALDRLEARKAQRLDPREILKPVEIKSYDDIKRVVNELDPRRNPVQAAIPIKTLMNVNEDNKAVTYRVEANTRSKSKRDILIDGLDIIKNRLAITNTITMAQEAVEVNNHPMKPALLGYSANGTSWVDALIKQWLGARRDEIMICWDLSDGWTYEYNIYEHRLVRYPTKSSTDHG